MIYNLDYEKARGLFENYERMWQYDSPLDFMEDAMDPSVLSQPDASRTHLQPSTEEGTDVSHKVFVTINGQTIQTEGEVVVRVYNTALEDVDIPNDQIDCGLNFKFTHEGVIADFVEHGEVAASVSNTYDEIKGGLL